MSYSREIISNERTGESYVKIKHPSGLDVLIWKMPGFSTVEALFGTNYGSVNTRFKTGESEQFIEVPEGIAHFLEHKLFENEDCDVFDLYAETGANANAYTTFDHTAYTFSTSGDYKKPLEILLSFVQKPYFTQKTVDKEQGIIAQEIKMLEDSPERKCFFNLLKAMYKNHPIRVDIAGSVESISNINASLLYDCYNTFYNLHNMALSIAGNVDEDEITTETTFIDDLGADSLYVFQIIMGLEEEFDIEIANEDAEKIVTVGDALEQIKNAMN